MSILGKLKHKTIDLKRQIIVIYYAYHNPEINLLPRIIILICVAYALSPIDLIPDFIPVIGYLDDLIIIPALLTLAIKLIPKNILEESIKKAESERISLKKNWAFAIIFITIWIILIIAIIKAFFGTIANI